MYHQTQLYSVQSDTATSILIGFLYLKYNMHVLHSMNVLALVSSDCILIYVLLYIQYSGYGSKSSKAHSQIRCQHAAAACSAAAGEQVQL